MSASVVFTECFAIVCRAGNERMSTAANRLARIVGHLRGDFCYCFAHRFLSCIAGPENQLPVAVEQKLAKRAAPVLPDPRFNNVRRIDGRYYHWGKQTTH